MTAPQGDGNCFEAAMDLCLQMALEAGPAEQVVVCHGIATGQGPIEGIRYWHAWLERRGTVYDFSNGLHVMMPRAEYYAIGRIDRSSVHRFTAREVAEQALAWGHYGPWVEGWEEAC